MESLYVGIYYANGEAPQLRLYKRVGGAWTQLGASYDCGMLATGTKLRLVVVGSTLAFLQDGVERIAAYDADITTGAPGIAIAGTDVLDDWTGGNAGFEAHYVSTDGNGVETYNMISACNGYAVHTLRVLRPTSPAPGKAHQFLYALPVSPEGDTTYGDGLETLRLLDAHNQYNVTIITPSFQFYPWYADHPTELNYRYESFMSLELQPWVTANLASTGSEQHWLLGFSKSGFGGIDLMLKHRTCSLSVHSGISRRQE
jgi:Predicted esterase